MQIEEIELTVPVFPRWLSLSLALVALLLLLLVVRLRYGSILQPIRQKLTLRVLLASISGWLGAWFILPFSFFPIPEAHGFFVPGALFGALVMVPALGSSAKEPVQGVLYIWAATVAYAMMWLTGMLVPEMFEPAVSHLFGTSDEIAVAYEGTFYATLIGMPAGIVFSGVVGAAIFLGPGYRLNARRWFLLIALGAICGALYAGVVIDAWPEWSEALEHYTFEDSPIYLVQVLWYASFGVFLNECRHETAPPNHQANFLLISFLVLLTILAGWSLGLDHYPYEWFG
jgi:hypothetical protein